MTRAALLVRWLILIALTALTIWLSVRIVIGPTDRWNWIIPVATLIPAWVVLLRRDWHVVGWLLLVVAAVQGAQFVEVAGSPVLSPEWLGWIYGVLNVGFWAAMAALVAVFPDGIRNQEGGPRLMDRVIVNSAWLATTLSAFTAEVQATGWSEPTDPPLYDNPLGFGFFSIEASAVLTVVAIVLFIAATVTLVVRTRRATGAVRQQYRWVLFPFAVLIVGVPIAITITQLRGEAGGEWLIAIVGYIGIPICFGVAMTRYRLYDIGKIISRTVTYAVVVALLGATYFGLVTLITSLVPSQNALAVAGSTLAVATLFNPVRKRIQLNVDRRFNRSGYRAETVSDEFALKLQETLTTEEIVETLTATVGDALHPASAGVWVKGT